MSDQLTLAAETRDRAGKGASRALRRDGRVPAVVYGMNKDPEVIHLEEKALRRALGTGHFMNTVVMINGQRTLPKDVAFPGGVREVAILRDGAVRVIVPADRTWDDFFANPGIDIGERDQPAQQVRETL